MKKIEIILVGIVSLFVITGCQSADSDNQTSQMKQKDPTLNVSYDGAPEKTQKHSQDDLNRGTFGYVHYQRKPGTGRDQLAANIPKIDNRELADMVTRLTLSMPHVYDAATLVTSQYILVGYKTDLDDREMVADQVKRTALSTVPGYYDIYISDQNDAIDKISQFKDLTVSTPQVNGLLKSMISEMKQAPQGQTNGGTNSRAKMNE